MNKLPIFILIFGLLLVASQVIGIFWTGEKIRQTDQKVSELAASIESLSGKVDSSIQKTELIGAHVTTGLNAVAQGKWKIVQLPKEVHDEAAAVSAIHGCPCLRARWKEGWQPLSKRLDRAQSEESIKTD